MAGPMPNGVMPLNRAKPATQAITTIATHTSRGHLRTASPNMSSAGAVSRPSAGSSSHPAMYRITPSPPLSASRAQPTRTSTGSMPQCRATPPHRPASLTSLVLRRMVQIELTSAILPSGLRLEPSGTTPKPPSDEDLRVESGSSLLGVEENGV